MKFGNTSNYPIGLDISDLSLKLFQLSKLGDQIKIQAISKVDLPKGLIENGEIKNQAEVLKAIKQLISKPLYGKVNVTDIVACLPETKTFIKLIEIEKSPNDFELTLRGEMEKHFPVALDEIFYDWQIISETPTSRKVLVGAGPKSIINQYTDLIAKSNIPLSALEVESVPICRSLLVEEHYKNKLAGGNTYGILDIGAKRTSLTVYSSKTIVFTVSIPLSGSKITEEISKQLNIDYQLAEKAKIVCGLDDNKAQGVIKNILSSVINDLVFKIKGVIRYYEDHFPNQDPISKILLCGGGSNIENIDKILASALELDVECGNPMINLNENKDKFLPYLQEKLEIGHHNLTADGDKVLATTQDTMLTYATAIGLALRGIFIDE